MKNLLRIDARDVFATLGLCLPSLRVLPFFFRLGFCFGTFGGNSFSLFRGGCAKKHPLPKEQNPLFAQCLHTDLHLNEGISPSFKLPTIASTQE